MYQLGAVVAWYFNWCHDRAEMMPRWQGYAIEFLAIFGLVAVVIFGPNWAILTYWVVVLGPVGVFGVAHSRVWRKRDELRRQQFNSGMRTKGLLDRFK